MSPQRWTKRTGTDVPFVDAPSDVSKAEAVTKRTGTNVPKTEVVTADPLVERYNRDYHGVKIKNETDFELTDDILNPEGLSINKNNIIIFHTHTCESYTQSEAYTYEETRNI